MALFSSGEPIDWTNGTGVFPGGGSFSIPANPNRKWFFVQNQDIGTVQVTFAAYKAADGTATTVTMLLGPGGSSGSQGGADERSIGGFLPLGAITVAGAAGQKVMVVEC